MNMKNKFWLTHFANDLDAFIPEVWAQESLMILFENVVWTGLVHTDFSDEIAEFGDVVNTRQPAKFVSKRKTDADDVTDQDAIAPNVPVKLNLHEHVSFVIKDGQESKGFKNLRQTYLVPALEAIAKGLEQDVSGARFEFVNTNDPVGNLGTALTKANFIKATTQLDNQLCPENGRNFIVSAGMKGDILNIADFTTADKIGDPGTVMRTGSLGELMGMRTHMSQNSKIISGNQKQLGILINNAAGYAKGTTVLTVDGLVGGTAPVPGEWITVAGDDTPQMLTSVTGGGTPTSLTITPGLKRAVVDNAAIVHYRGALVNNALGYAVDFAKDITVDGLTTAPNTGSLVSAGVTSARDVYGARSTPTTTAIGLNRALATALADNAVMGIGPDGDYGFAFHRNAIALISRPLALPAQGVGALSAVVNMNGVGLRVTITYDGKAQGHRVTVDLLAGIKVLDQQLGVLVYG